MTKLFNSPLELSLRALLTLEVAKNIKSSLTLDDLATADFMSIYSKEFKLAKTNLHGDNEFSFTEFALRRKQFDNAIKSLVREALISVIQTETGFQYRISSRGEAFCQQLTSSYAKAYRKATARAQTYMAKKSENELLTLILQEAAKSLQGGETL